MPAVHNFQVTLENAPLAPQVLSFNVVVSQNGAIAVRTEDNIDASLVTPVDTRARGTSIEPSNSLSIATTRGSALPLVASAHVVETHITTAGATSTSESGSDMPPAYSPRSPPPAYSDINPSTTYSTTIAAAAIVAANQIQSVPPATSVAIQPSSASSLPNTFIPPIQTPTRLRRGARPERRVRLIRRPVQIPPVPSGILTSLATIGLDLLLPVKRCSDAHESEGYAKRRRL
ncbi:hypothetical protein C8F04DRAFT_1115823 [Mycena alexandri]|uniref:Uncharacterized protein n=1 Tax=Mycena alexandri TaxID=1745969 RepID=A0AAD6SNX8_9AGAR|nr:hypothetical protein C8F04DRAFT_1115823 [Mycena alexandri]